MKEGSGPGAGSIPLTSGSGSRRPKNMRIRWIRIRIRIRNTAWKRRSGALCCCCCPLAEVSFSDACFRFTATWLRGAGSSALGNQTTTKSYTLKRAKLWPTKEIKILQIKWTYHAAGFTPRRASVNLASSTTSLWFTLYRNDAWKNFVYHCPL